MMEVQTQYFSEFAIYNNYEGVLLKVLTEEAFSA